MSCPLSYDRTWTSNAICRVRPLTGPELLMPYVVSVLTGPGLLTTYVVSVLRQDLDF
jgi:hypothetical protein